MISRLPLLFLFVSGTIFLIVLLWIIATLNRFARLRNLLRESWSNVDVLLKRRHDLIPNLVKVVERYAEHERELFDRVLQARQALESRENDIVKISRGESELSSLIGSIVARAEAYPDLKSSSHFLELQKELANTEDRIAAARRFYNANVREYRIALQSFPSSLLAGGVPLPEFFEIEFSERLHPLSVESAM